MDKTIRLTIGQAVALFLQNQWTERDGMEQRLIPKACGIYGHGNLSGLGQGFVECGREIEFHQPFHEQSMVHMAVGYARAKRRLATMACTASIGPGTANMYTGAAGATSAKVHKASTGEALSLSLNQAKSEDGLSVVVIEVDPYKMSVGTKNSFWDIAPPMESKDPKAQELRRSYEERRDKIQRYYL